MRLLYLDFSSKTIVQLLHYSFNVAKMGVLERNGSAERPPSISRSPANS